MKKYATSFFIICLQIVLLSCTMLPFWEEPVEEFDIEQVKPTLSAIVALGNINFTGETQITFPSGFNTCTGRSTDVTLQMGSPKSDGLIRSELTVLVPFRWDSDCSEIPDPSAFYAWGDYDPKTQTIIFSGCPGETSTVFGTSLLINEFPVLGFDGTVECFEGETLWYRLDYSVRRPDM